MTPASPEFGELFSALLEVSTGSLKPVLPLAKLPVSTSSYSDWRRGAHVPSRKVLDGFLAKLKPLVGYSTWHRDRIRRFDELAGRLQRIAAMREDALFSTYTRLRALSADAWADANQVIKPDRGLFREGVQLEDLYVPRKQERDIVAAALGQAGAQLIAGEAGCGKTTLLWSIFRTLDSHDGVKPLLVKASYLIAALRTDAADPATAVRLEDIRAAVRCCLVGKLRPVVLVDTLDLLAHSAEGLRVVSRLLSGLKELNVPAVLTCRPGEAALLRFPAETGDGGETREAVDDLGGYLRPQRVLGWYDEDERRAAIHRHAQVFCPDWKYGPGAAERLEDSVLGAVYQGLPLREVCDNPLYLRLLFDLYAPAPPLQNVDVAGLFDRVRDMRIKRDARPGQDDADGGSGAARRDLSPTARALGRYMLAANTIEYLPRDAGDTLQRLVPGSTPDTIDSDLRELNRRGMVVSVPGTGAIRFFHQTFFEYMAAEYLRVAGRSGELVDRMLEQPEDLVLAAVAGQLIPRVDRGTDERLLTPLFADARLTARALELYAQMRDPGAITATARTAMASAPEVVLRRFLHLLPGHAHRSGPERWTADLATVWLLTADRPPLRYQLFAAVRRLAQQHGPAAVEFCESDGRLSWWLSMSSGPLTSQKNGWFDLLRALLRHDPTQTLRWMAQPCGTLLAAGINGVVAEAVDLVRDEIARIPQPARRARARKKALAQFEKLLDDREGREQKSLLQVEQAVGLLWAECQQADEEQQLVALVTTALAEAGESLARSARLFGAGRLAGRLSPAGARTVMTRLLALAEPAVQTKALNHILVPVLRGGPSPLREELENACRAATEALPCRPKEPGGRRATASWLTNALAEAQVGGDRLPALLPESASPRLWLSTDGLAALVGPAAAAGHRPAVDAARIWASGELDGDAEVARSVNTVRTSLTAQLGTSSLALDLLVEECARRGPGALTDLLTKAARSHATLDTESVREQIEAQFRDTGAHLADRLNLWRTLVAHGVREPPAADDLAGILAEASPGTSGYAVALDLVETAAGHGHWSWAQTAELRKRLRAEAARALVRQKGAPSPDRALATLFVHLAPLETAAQRDRAVATVMDLALPEGGLAGTDIQHARTITDLLRKVAAVSAPEAADGLITVSERLRSGPNSVAEHLGKHSGDIMATVLRELDATERKDLITSLAEGEPALATAAIGAFAFLAEDGLFSKPPAWFRALGHDLRIDPVVRTAVNSRLSIQARLRCGGPWPELLQEVPRA